MTSTHGILSCFFSITLRSHSNPLPVVPTLALPPPIRLRTPSMAALAIEPPVPLMADTAKLAVSRIASATVALPVTRDDIVSDAVSVDGRQRASNQFALRSKREKMRTKSRIEQ